MHLHDQRNKRACMLLNIDVNKSSLIIICHLFNLEH